MTEIEYQSLVRAAALKATVTGSAQHRRLPRQVATDDATRHGGAAEKTLPASESMRDLVVIGVDPSMSKQGLCIITKTGAIDKLFTRPIGKTTARDCYFALGEVLEYYRGCRFVVAVEEWTVAAAFFKGRDGKKETNWNTVKGLERSAQDWVAAATILGFIVKRVNAVTWQKAYHVKATRKNTVVPMPTTKQQAQETVKILFGMSVGEDVADAILIANFVYSTEKFSG